MGVSKVETTEEVLIDLTSDTVTENTLAKGVTAHDKSGNQITGTMESSSGPTIEEKTTTGGGSTSISFTGLSAQPKAFMIHSETQFNSSSTRSIISVCYNGSATHGNWVYESSKNQYSVNYHSTSYFTWTYSNGTLTVKSTSTTNGGVFRSSTTYRLTYIY